MTESATETFEQFDDLNKAFIVNFPSDAARRIAIMSASESAEALLDLPNYILVGLFEKLSHGVADKIILKFPDLKSAELISIMDVGIASSLLSRLDESTRNRYFELMGKGAAEELSDLLEYPDNSAGRLMQTKVIAFDAQITVDHAIKQIKEQKIEALHHLYLLDDAMRLTGQVDIQRLALADGERKLESLALPIKVWVSALDPKEEAVDKLKAHRLDSLPVVDIDFKLVGTIEGQAMIDALREDLVTNMQTMVGVSKEERALSSSWFAVKKRLPWLQVNLLTAFLAAAVVGMFEATIAKYTALAILLPIAAGQSGNTGAQALAVTMRGLTLREITVRHWLRVTMKEVGAGIINGLATALTCGLGVYVWSRSYGLALIIALAMISSMTIAAASGALVPIILKKLGQDPALSSSIILTTVTDIAGFMSFLGIATALSGMLEVG
ncbi:MAG: magnesium transporter [Opitutaceae bacterium]